jgi:uncharacterized LabA/DUF88 family protein
MEDSYKNIVVLVDADNAQVGMLKNIIEDVAKYGRIAVKEAFGDWSTDTLKSWPPVLLDLGFHSIQQFAYTKQKNASDIELVISAMDLITNPKYDLYVLVSSDSDFTPLAIRLKESGASVYGYGEKKTPNPFVQSCDRFFYTENLSFPAEKKSKKTALVDLGDVLTIQDVLAKLASLSDSHEGEGWVLGSEAGDYLAKISPSFSPKDYHFSKFTDLVKAFPTKFETKLVPLQNGENPLFYFRNKVNKR